MRHEDPSSNALLKASSILERSNTIHMPWYQKTKTGTAITDMTTLLYIRHYPKTTNAPSTFKKTKPQHILIHQNSSYARTGLLVWDVMKSFFFPAPLYLFFNVKSTCPPLAREAFSSQRCLPLSRSTCCLVFYQLYPHRFLS